MYTSLHYILYQTKTLLLLYILTPKAEANKNDFVNDKVHIS